MNLSYLDAFVDTVKILRGKRLTRKLSKAIVDQLNPLHAKDVYKALNPKDLHKALQFILIKAVREDKIQANHQETPDVIAFIMGYIMIRLLKGKSRLKLLDVSVGTGNLLITVMSQLKKALRCQISALGLDIDDTLVRVARSIAALQHQKNLQLNYQDAVVAFPERNFDLAISDLPVGYYPLDKNAKSYQLGFIEGHSYAHYLLIEQAMKHVRPGGFGEFLVPSDLFSASTSKKMLKWLQNSAYLQGMLNLPRELFTDVHAQKAILLLQKHGSRARQVQPVMIGEFPSFKKPAEFQRFIAEIVEWEEQDFLSNRDR